MTKPSRHIHDVIVVGGGPSGATAANDLALAGRDVVLLDKAGRIKPCGGAIPPRAIRDFDVPDELLVAKISSARMVSPSDRAVDMPIDGGYVGMVDREHFDEWLRERAAGNGAIRIRGTYKKLDYLDDGTIALSFEPRDDAGNGERTTLYARAVVGADGAKSAVGRQTVPGADKMPFVFAYHEIVKSPEQTSDVFDGSRCDVYYQGKLSPDFYAWIFPHGSCTSIGVGSANKGFSLRGAVEDLRQVTGTDACQTIRGEGAPIPLKPLKRWDDGRGVLLAGDAAGVVAPASGEGIYYAMAGGRLAAETMQAFLQTGDARQLAQARKRFMKSHGRVFWVLGMMQKFWYTTDKRRERFVSMCADPDVQRLTWEAYMNKELVRGNPMAHVRIFFKDMAHLLGITPAAPDNSTDMPARKV
jgi:geranylgeranyl reductase